MQTDIKREYGWGPMHVATEWMVRLYLRFTKQDGLGDLGAQLRARHKAYKLRDQVLRFALVWHCVSFVCVVYTIHDILM